MRHEDVIQVLNDPLAEELMASNIPVRLAYTGIDGFPRVIPLGFLWNGSRFVVCTIPNAPKVRALKENPKVAMTIDTNSFPPHVLLVRGTATVEVVEGVPSEFLDGAKKLVEEQQMQEFEAQVRGLYKQMARIEIVPEWAKLMDFETRLPSAVEQLLNR